MNKVIIFLYYIDIISFIYIFLFGLIFNILLVKNKRIIKQYFTENGYKLYFYDNGNFISRNKRIKVIEALVMENDKIKNRKALLSMLKLYNGIYFAFTIIFLVSVGIPIISSFFGR